jgi:hypothetical protein
LGNCGAIRSARRSWPASSRAQRMVSRFYFSLLRPVFFPANAHLDARAVAGGSSIFYGERSSAEERTEASLCFLGAIVLQPAVETSSARRRLV